MKLALPIFIAAILGAVMTYITVKSPAPNRTPDSTEQESQISQLRKELNAAKGTLEAAIEEKDNILLVHEDQVLPYAEEQMKLNYKLLNIPGDYLAINVLDIKASRI